MKHLSGNLWVNGYIILQDKSISWSDGYTWLDSPKKLFKVYQISTDFFFSGHNLKGVST